MDNMIINQGCDNNNNDTNMEILYTYRHLNTSYHPVIIWQYDCVFIAE